MIDEYITKLIQEEGGYSNNPADSGGETMYGITAAVARAFGYQDPMRDLPLPTAIAIYRARYWEQPKFDQVDKLSPDIAYKLFDFGVNAGQATSARMLQRALSVLGDQVLALDGHLGAMSIAALAAFLQKRGKDGEKVLLGMITGQQSVHYIELAEQRVSQKQFEYGWQLNRALGVAVAA